MLSVQCVVRVRLYVKEKWVVFSSTSSSVTHVRYFLLIRYTFFLLANPQYRFGLVMGMSFLFLSSSLSLKVVVVVVTVVAVDMDMDMESKSNVCMYVSVLEF